MNNKSITNFCFELGVLRRIKHEGWRIAGIESPESVADHTLRAAQIAFFLAHMENYPNPHEVATMVIFHDIGEVRVGDVHKIASRYIKVDEEQAVKDQLENLGTPGAEILNMWQQVEERSSRAGIIAKDADQLEQAFTAKEYIEKGIVVAQEWISSIRPILVTDSAKKLLEELVTADSNDWWLPLRYFGK